MEVLKNIYITFWLLKDRQKSDKAKKISYFGEKNLKYP